MPVNRNYQYASMILGLLLLIENVGFAASERETFSIKIRDDWYKEKRSAPGILGFFFSDTKYLVCDHSENPEPQNWLRTGFIDFNGAKRVFLSVHYTIRKCFSRYCKETFKLYLAQTAKSSSAPIPPNGFDHLATANPTNIKEGVPDERNMTVLNATIIAKNEGFYLAFFDQGACLTLYSIKIWSFFCPEKPENLELVRFPKVASPADDAMPLQVKGHCSDLHARSTTAILGVCTSNGHWKINKDVGCFCRPGYGYEQSFKQCRGCDSDHYKTSLSNTQCLPCPSGSYSTDLRTSCMCHTGLYRLNRQALDTTCYGLPSAPRDVKSTFKNASFVTIEWTTPLDLGGRSDVYYQVECNKCNDEGRNCDMDCTGAVITHTPRTSRKATVQHLSAYTYYQFKVSSKNGVSHLAEMDGEKSKYAARLVLTGQSDKRPGTSGSDKNKTDIAVLPVLLSVVAFLLLIVIIGLIVFFLRKRRRREKLERTEQREEHLPLEAIIPEDRIPEETTGNYYTIIPDDTLWEVPRENVSVIKRLGSGNFGCVDKATAIGLYGHPGQVTVAVKTLKENASERDKENFLTELNLMMKLERHPRVVEFLGCCTKSTGPMSIILEYLPYGDLLGYLRRSRGHEDTYCSGDLRPEGRLKSRDLLQFAWMIADGMNFLAQNKCVHRDLAARNVLVGENKICKISDLGLARTIREDIYTRSHGARLPIKWMPPESVFYAQSSIASDVWSYGILLWEIFTLGDSPYPKYKGKDIPRLLQQGYRMPKPLHLSETLYSLMLRCWQDRPEDRPSFSLLCDEIDSFYNSTQDYINLDVFEDALYVNFDML